MSPHNGLKDARFLPQYLLLGMVSVFILMSSLFNQDIFLRIAVYGPLLSGSLGVIILVSIVDMRHGISSSIESRINAKIARLSESRARNVMAILLLIIPFNGLWIARVQLLNNNPHLFAASVLISAVILGFLFGRISISFTSSTTVRSAKKLFEDEGTTEEIREESHYILNCLVNNAIHKLNTSQRYTIEQQKNIYFHDLELKLDSESDLKKLFTNLEAFAKYPNTFEKKTIKLLTSKTENPVKQLYKYGIGNEKNVLNAILLLDCISLLLHKVTSRKEVSNDVVKCTLILLCDMIGTVSTHLPNDTVGNSMINSTGEHYKGMTSLMRRFIETITSEGFAWDPVLISVLFKRLNQAFNQLVLNSETSHLKPLNLRKIDSSVKESIFQSLTRMLLQYDSTSLLSAKKSFEHPDFKKNEFWNISPDEVKMITVHKALCKSIPLQKYTLPQQLLFCGWAVDQSLSLSLGGSK